MGDLIAAVSTGNVRSAIGIVRLSGEGAIGTVSKVFRAKSGVSMENAPAGKLIYGELIDEKGETLDLCLCTVSRAPKSYTGEDTAELQCHGSPVVLAEALRLLFKNGARQAAAGEFTKRAFLNGRMDLTGAEAVMDLIDAETAEAAKNASGQLMGAIIRKTDGVYSELLDMVSHFHAVVDWPDEDIEDFKAESYIETFEKAESTLSQLLMTFSRGRYMRTGVPCAIIGRPNVGKSSLLNALVGYDRAIVTDIAGTTRDTVEEKCVLGGVLLRLIDTAGMHDTEDTVEKIGVLRAKKAAEEAEIILAVVDAGEPITAEDLEVFRIAKESGKPWIFLPNKTDITKNEPAIGFVGIDAPCTIPISAKTGDGLDKLGECVRSMFGAIQPPTGELITNERQAEEVRRALEAVISAKSALESGMTPDAVLMETESAMTALGALSGKNLREDVVDRIFHRFCVGK